MKIYGSAESPSTRKVLMTLNEKKAFYELIPVDLSSGEHLRRHPFGVIPTLEEQDGYTLFESRAIIRYLDARLSGIKLTPQDVYDYGKMEQWISIEQSYFSPAALKILKQSLWLTEGQQPNKEIIKKAQQKLETVFILMEAVLEEQTNLAQGIFSLADICFMPYIDYLIKCDAIDLSSYPAVERWWERISTRPAWLAVLAG